jgi:hypothetical protein
MAVAVDGTNSTVAAVGVTVFIATLSGTITVGSGSNRVLLAIVGTADDDTSRTVFWDTAGANQAMTLIGGAASTTTNAKMYLYGLVAPVSGAKILTATVTGGGGGVVLDAISFTGADQTSVATAFLHFNSATGLSTAPAVTITTATNNYVVGAEINRDNCMTSMDHTTLNNNCNLFGYAANYAAGASGTITLAGVAVSSVNWAMVGVDVIAAGGGDVLMAQGCM